MPTKCKHYEHLTARFGALCSKFLDEGIAEEFASPGVFVPDLDKLAAFRLLFHAEIETFLEAKAIDQIALIQSDIDRGSWHRAHPCILSLYLLTQNYLQKCDGMTDEELKGHFFNVLSKARSRIRENNGIKADAFTFLSVAAGVPLDEIDATLLLSLTSYGKNRGEVAHATVTRARSLSAPSAEKKDAQDIVTQLGSYYDVIS